MLVIHFLIVFAATVICASTLNCSSALAIIEKAYLQNGELWLKNIGDEPRQVTKDGKPKSPVLISPNKHFVLYCIEGNQQNNFQTSIVLKNERGDTISEFRPRAHDGYCNSINQLDWIDDERIGIDCHCNPSMSLYLDVDKRTGKTQNEYYGYRFSWSPDRRTLAHVGQMIHFADWPHSEYIQFNNKNIYPKEGAVYGNDKIPVHTFISDFVWSPDSHKVAVVDDLSGSVKGKRLVIIVSGKAQPLLVKPLTGVGEFKLNWQDNNIVVVSSESGNKTFDLKTMR